MLLGTCILFYNALDLFWKQQITSIKRAKHEHDISSQGKAPHDERNCFLNGKNEKKEGGNKKKKTILSGLQKHGIFLDMDPSKMGVI